MMILRRRVMGRIVGSQYIAVDLGLPSGILWCDRNVGAVDTEDVGLYFSWGNIVGHPVGDGYDWSESSYNNTSGASATSPLASANDAASVIMGDGWRIPSGNEYRELVQNCSFTWVSDNGIYGGLFTSNINGNSIFLPNAKYRYNASQAGGYADNYSFYWTNEKAASSTKNRFAIDAYLRPQGLSVESKNRYLFWGFVIRGIKDV